MSDALRYLFGLETLGIKFGLDNIRTLTGALGEPHRAYRTLIVAGTNGKGSVSAMVASALTAGGLRTGCYTSPHLVELEERFTIDGEVIGRDDLEQVVGDLRNVIDELLGRGELKAQPTFFEVTTAAAFEIFRRRRVDMAVLEVGLGGRFDATNIASPIAGAITSIDLDHERLLGRTIAEIAFEKAGIIKPGMTIVAGEQKREALDVFAGACRERGARLIRSWEGVTLESEMVAGQARLGLTTPRRPYPAFTLALRGRHQVQNALVAIRLLEAIEEFGVMVDERAILHGLTLARWRGRLDLVAIGGGRQVLLDAAHNPAGAASLAAYLGEVYPGGVPLVFAVMADKDRRGMLQALLPHATRVVVTVAPTPRAASTAELRAAIAEVRPELPVDIEEDPRRALDLALADAPVVCVAGSIFLLGALLPYLESMRPERNERR